MFKYESVIIKIGWGRWSSIETKNSYHETLNRNAENGWRLIQIIDRSFIYGEVVLIFEKEVC